MNMLTWHNWQVTNEVMIFISVGLIVLMIAALPWGRRVWDRSGPDEFAGEGVPAQDALVVGPVSAEVRPPDVPDVPDATLLATRPLADYPPQRTGRKVGSFGDIADQLGGA